MVKSQGLQRLYRGVGTMFMACIPSHAAYFSLYEYSKAKLGANQPGHHPLAAATSGVVSTLAHDSIMTPMDTVKQRLQLGYYRGIRHCVMHMARHEGFSAFYVALPTTLLMNLPFGAIMVTSNESLKTLLTGPSGERDIFTYLAAGSGAGAIAAAATTPLDMIKTRLQTQHMSAQVGSSMGSVAMMGSGGGSGGGGSASGSGSGSGSGSSGGAACGSRAPQNPQIRNTMTATIRPSTTRAGVEQVAAAAMSAAASAPRLNGIIDAVKSIHREYGMFGFFRGFYPRLIVTTPSVAISWTAYETAKSALAGRI